jgi:hypothetical protein
VLPQQRIETDSKTESDLVLGFIHTPGWGSLSQGPATSWSRASVDSATPSVGLQSQGSVGDSESALLGVLPASPSEPLSSLSSHRLCLRKQASHTTLGGYPHCHCLIHTQPRASESVMIWSASRGITHWWQSSSKKRSLIKTARLTLLSVSNVRVDPLT